MKTISCIAYLLIIPTLFVACENNSGGQSATEQAVSTTDEQQINDVSIANKYLLGDNWNATLAVKSAFDEGLSTGYGKRTIDYIYQQHALRLKLDVLQKESFAHLYPYNDAFKLEDHQELVDKLPFITKKCGFQDVEKGKTIHYYCLSLEGGFLDFLTDLGKDNQLIASFASNYRQNKSLDRNVYQDILISGESELNFQNLDHQLFYSFVHILTHEEVLATKRFAAMEVNTQ